MNKKQYWTANKAKPHKHIMCSECGKNNVEYVILYNDFDIATLEGQLCDITLCENCWLGIKKGE